MFSIAKRLTSGVIAGAVIVGSLAVYPIISGNKTIVNAATKYDSASAINYATILGGAVDYGIVAQSIVQNQHMETTFATNRYVHNASNVDVDYIDSTALFLIQEIATDKPDANMARIEFGYTTASAIYLEGPESVYGPNYDSQVHHQQFDPTDPARKNLYNANIWFKDGFAAEPNAIPFIQAINEHADANVNRLINRACSPYKVEDAEQGWAYFLQDRALDPAYVLNNGNTVPSPAVMNLDTNGHTCTINIENEEFAGKVVYINLTPEMIACLAVDAQFVVQKRQDTVVVFNIEDSVVNGTLVMQKPKVVTNGLSYVGCTAINGDRNASGLWGSSEGVKASDIQTVYNETVIWNVMTSKPVEVNNMGGVMLFPNASNINISSGNSSGWIVADTNVDINNEFHFLYQGSSPDGYGDMHFALTKAFTENYAAHGSVQQDTSVSIPSDGYYNFTFQEYARPENDGDPEFVSTYGSPVNTPVIKSINPLK